MCIRDSSSGAQGCVDGRSVLARQAGDVGQVAELGDAGALREVGQAVPRRLAGQVGVEQGVADAVELGGVADGGRTIERFRCCLLYTSPSPRDGLLSRMPSSA